jgi:RNA polymerase sigma factor (sigma-70 family)
MLQELLDAALTGDKTAENRLFEYLRVRFNYLATLKVGNDAAEDLAQDACLTVLEKYKDVGDFDNFSGWAYGILKNKIANYLRHEGRWSRLVSGGQSPEIPNANAAPSPDSDLHNQLLSCLRKLIDKNLLYARVLNFVYQGYATDKICKVLHIKRGHFYVLLNRARNVLADCLRDKS